MNLMTLRSECPMAVCVLQSERTVCPSNPGSKGTRVCRGEPGAGLCKNAIQGAIWGRDISTPPTKGSSSCVEARGISELMPKPCAKLNPALITHVLQQGFTVGPAKQQWVPVCCWGSCQLQECPNHCSKSRGAFDTDCNVGKLATHDTCNTTLIGKCYFFLQRDGNLFCNVLYPQQSMTS